MMTQLIKKHGRHLPSSFQEKFDIVNIEHLSRNLKGRFLLGPTCNRWKLATGEMKKHVSSKIRCIINLFHYADSVAESTQICLLDHLTLLILILDFQSNLQKKKSQIIQKNVYLKSYPKHFEIWPPQVNYDDEELHLHKQMQLMRLAWVHMKLQRQEDKILRSFIKFGV